MRRQCRLLKLPRSTAYYQPRLVSDTALALMRRRGIESLYRKPDLSRRHPAHTIYPYLLRDLTISRPKEGLINSKFKAAIS